MSRLLITVFIVSCLCIGLVLPAWAGQLELSGKQTRGHGTNGTIKCDGVNLPAGGRIVSVSDEGEGFWLNGPSGNILKFPRGTKAAGTFLSAGKWYAYPYMPNSRDTVDVVVTIRTPGGASSTGSSSSFDGTWSLRRTHSGCCSYSAEESVTFSTDASGITTISGSLPGRGTVKGNTYTFNYGSGRTGSLTLSADGRGLSGTFSDLTSNHRGTFQGRR
jgi:hypothetical protein